MAGRVKRALVTGASSGIGAAVVRRLRAEGLAVVALARRVDRLEELGRTTGATPLAVDLADTSALYAALEGLEIDVLVNNAGVGHGMGGLFTASPSDIERTLRTNVEAAIHVVRAVVPGMIARGEGHVFHIGSIAGLYPLRSALYGASKGAIHLFAQNLRIELSGTGVRSTEIVPGRVRTEFFVAAGVAPAAATEIVELAPEDIAAAISHALAAPRHVDVTMLEILPTEQAVGGVVMQRGPA